MALTPEMRTKVQVLGEQVKQRVQKAQRRAQEKAREMGGEVGSDSPQAMTMQMMQRNSAARNFAIVRKGARRALLEVLTTEQVTNWVVAPVVRP